MIRYLIKFPPARHLLKLTDGHVVPVRCYPRRRHGELPTHESSDFLQMEDDGDALDESEITSHLDEMEDKLMARRPDQDVFREENARRLWLKNKIIERKFFKKSPELNLLSWRAKEQIRYLHGEYPDEWTVTKLAQSFPISENGIIKILKSNFSPMTEQEIHKHDMAVRRRWLALKSHLNQSNEESIGLKGGPIVTTLKELVASKRLSLMINAGGFDDINFPQMKHNKQGKSKVGTFEAIIKDYVEKEARMQQENIFSGSLSVDKCKPLLADISSLSKVNKMSETEKETSSSDNSDESETNGVTDSAVSRRGRRLVQSLKKGTLGDFPLVNTHMEELGMQGTGFVKKTLQQKKNALDFEQTGRPHRSEFSYTENSREKLKREKMTGLQNLKFEKHETEEDDSDVYMYDTQTGYQYPLGKSDRNLEKLDVPRSLKNKGDLYQKGNYVYDEDGEFLFKIP